MKVSYFTLIHIFVISRYFLAVLFVRNVSQISLRICSVKHLYFLFSLSAIISQFHGPTIYLKGLTDARLHTGTQQTGRCTQYLKRYSFTRKQKDEGRQIINPLHGFRGGNDDSWKIFYFVARSC